MRIRRRRFAAFLPRLRVFHEGSSFEAPVGEATINHASPSRATSLRLLAESGSPIKDDELRATRLIDLRRCAQKLTAGFGNSGTSKPLETINFIHLNVHARRYKSRRTPVLRARIGGSGLLSVDFAALIVNSSQE